KRRLEDLLAASFERIVLRGARAAQVGGVDRAIFVENLGKAYGDGCSCRTFDLQARPADHVLTEIEDIRALRLLRKGLCRERLQRLDRRVALRHQPGGGIRGGGV